MPQLNLVTDKNGSKLINMDTTLLIFIKSITYLVTNYFLNLCPNLLSRWRLPQF